MATYIPNITDVFPEPYIYKPDLAFYDKMLQRKTALYEQGISKARSLWESVLNAPLSNKYNIPIRDQYIKQARENLQKMAGADFSQPQTIASARGIFAPFWEDKFIVRDSELTKAYQNEAQILDGWKNSSDPKVRENYNGIAAVYLNNGLQKLIDAERTDDGFSNIEKRKAVPFTNLEKYLNDIAGKDGLKIVWDETNPDGAYLVSTENGERSKKHFATWAESMIGNNFYEQFKVTGVVEKEERYKQYKNAMPNMTDQQIYEKIADDVVGELDKGYKKRKDNVTIEIARIDGLLKSMPKTLTPEYQKAALQYQKQKAELLGKSDAIDKEYEINFPKDYQTQLKNNIVLNPDGFFAKLAKQRVVDNWSTGVSSLESRKIKPNETFFKAQEVEQNRKKFELDVLNYELDKQEAEWKRDQELWERMYGGKDGKTTGTTTNAAGQLVDKKGNVIAPPVEGIDAATGGRYVGIGTTNIIKQGTAAEIFDKRQKELFYSAYNLAFNADGLLYFAKQGLGLTDAEVASIASAFDNELRGGVFNPGAPDYKFTPEQVASTNKLANLLEQNPYVKAAGITKLTGPGTMRNALIAYTQGYLKDRVDEAKNHKDENENPAPLDFILNAQEQKALINYNVAKTNLETYIANDENRKQILDKYAKANPSELNKYFTKKDDGSYELLTPEKLSKIPEMKVFDNLNILTSVQIPFEIPTPFTPGFPGLKTNAPVKANITTNDIARAIISGGFSYKIKETGEAAAARTGDAVGINRVEFTIKGQGQKIDGTYFIDNPSKGALAFKELEKKIGNLEKYNEGYKKVYNSTVPNLLFFQNQTGVMGVNFRFDFDKNKRIDKAYTILDEALEQANAAVYVEENGNIREANTAEMQAIRVFKGKEEEMEKYFGGFTYNTAGGGKLQGRANISIDFAPYSDASKIVVGGQSLPELAKKKFIFAINENNPSLGMNLSQLPNNSGYYIYQSLLRGKQFKSDDMMNATGFNFTLTPNLDGSTAETMPTNVRLNLKYNVRINDVDPVTKQMTTRLEERQVTDRTFNLQEKTPDEIVYEMQKLYYDNLLANQAKQTEYENSLKTQKNRQQIGGQPTTPVVVDRDLFFSQNGIIFK